MANDSSTGGYLTPTGAVPADDASLDAIIQAAVAGITGLDGTLVRPRWQATVPKQPEAAINWCAIGVLTETPDAGPYIVHVGTGAGSDTFMDHEDIEALATFYGPLAGQYAQLLRDGLGLPQNTEVLAASQIRFIECGPIRTVPEYVDTQWIMRKDMSVHLRRKTTRVYPIDNLLIGVIDLTDDTSVVIDIVVPPGSTVEP